MEYTKINNPMNDTENNVVTNEKIESLAKLFPEVVKDGEIDFKALKEELGKFDEVGTEKFELTWAGKQNAKKKYLENVSNRTLKFLENDSKNPNETENLYIEGDNLEVLKLLRKNYYNSIKMIYIDPPYNTDKDFIYNDSFKMSQEESNKIEGYIGFDNEKLEKVSQSSNRYHANWLNMMYPRLKTARDLLTDDGVIFIQIDDNEVDNLKKICDEILGENNFVNILSIKMKNIAGASGGGEDKKFKKNIEYILVYAKNYFELKQFKNSYEYTEIGELVNQYRENNVSWKYTTVLYERGDKKYIASTEDSDGNEIKIYSRKNVIIKSISQIMKDENISEREAYTKYSKQIFQTAMPQSSIRPRVMKKIDEIGKEDEIYSIEYVPKSGKNKGILYEQFYKGDNFRLFAWLKDVSEEINGVLYKKDLIGTFLDYVGETKNLSKEGEISFPNGKKPIKLLKKLLEMQTNSGDIILDFFSGSASTAHAVMQLNAEDGGNRKFIMVQLDELTYTGKKEKYKDKNGEQKEKYIIDDITGFPIVVKDSDARKSGYYTIPQIGRARIDNAGEQIKKEIEANNNNLKLGEEPKKVPDIGFKTLKTGNTNIKWNRLTNIIGENLTFAHNNDPDSMDFELATKDIDVVYELMLLQRDLPLSEKVITLDEIGLRTYLYANSYLVCLETQITDEIIEKIASINPTPIKFFFRDSAFGNDISLKDNIFNKFERIIEKNSISNKKTYTVEFI